MSNTLETKRAAAFGMLAEVVRDNHEAGRRSFGASLKPELKRRTDNSFSESDLGFPTFGRFLQAAADDGVIDLHKAALGPDSVATPPGEPPPLVGAVTRSSSPTSRDRIRGDLWSCFIDWRPNMRRIYHRATDRAYWFHETPDRREPPAVGAVREHYQLHPAGYVLIDPISFETQLGWMKEFTEGVDDEDAKKLLLAALGVERPARGFAQAISVRPDIRKLWRDDRLKHVREAIDGWASEHDLALDLGERIQETNLNRAPLSAAEPSRLEGVRALLHSAIDSMPESELLRITIPVEYLLQATPS